MAASTKSRQTVAHKKNNTNNRKKTYRQTPQPKKNVRNIVYDFQQRKFNSAGQIYSRSISNDTHMHSYTAYKRFTCGRMDIHAILHRIICRQTWRRFFRRFNLQAFRHMVWHGRSIPYRYSSCHNRHCGDNRAVLYWRNQEREPQSV